VLNIPTEIRHTVTDMALNDVVHVSDLKLPEGVRALQDPELVVCAVREVQEEVPAEAAEGETAEPEVIGRKAEEEGAPAEGEEKKE
jgi:large subunit ribosomal protein L25